MEKGEKWNDISFLVERFISGWNNDHIAAEAASEKDVESISTFVSESLVKSRRRLLEVAQLPPTRFARALTRWAKHSGRRLTAARAVVVHLPAETMCEPAGPLTCVARAPRSLLVALCNAAPGRINMGAGASCTTAYEPSGVTPAYSAYEPCGVTRV